MPNIWTREYPLATKVHAFFLMKAREEGLEEGVAQQEARRRTDKLMAFLEDN